MTAKILIGLDGSEAGDRAGAFAKQLAALIGDCELIALFVIEWSPYSFQTAEENAERHKRREAEIASAKDHVINPAINALKAEGFAARGMVKHGHVADLLNSTAVSEGASQIVVARSGERGLASRVFGTSTAHLAMTSEVPVTIVG